jgi:DNA repair exonuclease SbcCD ATPase subunit
MEGPLKELARLEKLTDKTSVNGKSPSISNSLDSLLQSLRDVKDRLEVGTQTQDTFGQLAVTVEARKKEVEDKQKEIYSSLSRFGKALDKVGAIHALRMLL